MPLHVSDTVDTILAIEGLGIPRWSSRALTETLTPIPAAAQVVRSINGQALNWGQAQFHKYKVTITCHDQRQLAFDGIWPGATVTIDCVTELAYPVGGTPGRTVVPGTQRTEQGFVFYRPRLICLFLGFNASTPEWEGSTQWTADFEEV